MYEFTMGGMWFRWRLLDRTSKRLAAFSLTAAMISAIPIGIIAGEAAYGIGYWVGSSGTWREVANPIFAAWMAWVVIGFGVLSAILWWRFSLRQDEMFNRVQNWALGMAGGWSMAGLSIWAMLDYAGIVPAPSPMAYLAIVYVLTAVFWMVAVKRWA